MTNNRSNLIEVPGWRGRFYMGPNHSYWWKDKALSEPRPLSGITSVLNVLSKPALIPWAARMVIEHIRKSEDWVSDIGFGVIFKTQEEWVEFTEDAKDAHTVRKDHAAGLGTDAHALVEDYIKACLDVNNGVPMAQLISAEPRVAEFAEWASARHTETGFRFIASETPLADPKFAIAGTPDFIGEETIENLPVVVIGDLKTGSGVYDRTFFAQMAAYGYMWAKRNRSKTRMALVVVHMPSQKPTQKLATYWSDDMRGDWEAFKSALYLHRWKDNFVKPKWMKK